MNQVEHLFDINIVLKHCYQSLKQLREAKQAELIFEMDNHIPRELRGNDIVFQQLLTTLFTFIFQHSNQKEILLTLTAPEDFMYEESIAFIVKETHIPKEKVLAFLETGLGNKLENLNGKIIYDKDSDIHLEIPFMIGELGFRRHYRLTLESMLKKKVLLIIESENVAISMSKMFKYFSYEVYLGYVEFKENRTNLAGYDLLIIDESLVTDSFSNTIGQHQEKHDFQCVLFGYGSTRAKVGSAYISTYLIKPVTQESVFDLILSLYEGRKDIKRKGVTSYPQIDEIEIPDIPIPESLQNKPDNSGIHEVIEDKLGQKVSVLNTNIGLANAKKNGTLYSKELENFLEKFDKSDVYFRQIVNEKQTNKIKDFCIDLEKESKVIGSESMQKFSEIVSLIFVYNKLDMLPIYPGKYHIELAKLVHEVKKYLHVG